MAAECFLDDLRETEYKNRQNLHDQFVKLYTVRQQLHWQLTVAKGVSCECMAQDPAAPT
jgi:hypothetical protein